jgi:hypothetical protein
MSMRFLQSVTIALAMSVTATVVAADFDGSVPLTCTAQTAHDCLPGQMSCSKLNPATDIPPVFGVDFAKKEVRSPFRTTILPVLHTATNKDSLVLQGAQDLVAWSALVDRKTGAWTVSIADSKGAYVAFGQCKVSDAKK